MTHFINVALLFIQNKSKCDAIFGMSLFLLLLNNKLTEKFLTYNIVSFSKMMNQLASHKHVTRADTCQSLFVLSSFFRLEGN